MGAPETTNTRESTSSPQQQEIPDITATPPNTTVQTTLHPATDQRVLNVIGRKPLETHLVDVDKNRNNTASNTKTVYDLTVLPHTLDIPTGALLRADDITEITIAVEKQSTKTVLPELRAQMREQVVMQLLREDDEFKNKYEATQHNRLTTILDYATTGIDIPQKIPFNDLPKAVQTRIQDEITTPSKTVKQATNVTEYKTLITRIENGHKLRNINVKLTTPSNSLPESVTQLLDEHGIEAVREDLAFPGEAITTSTHSPEALIVESR